MPASSAPPSCDDVARTYVRAVGRARADFIVDVQRQGEENPTCESSYGMDGHPKSGI